MRPRLGRRGPGRAPRCARSRPTELGLTPHLVVGRHPPVAQRIGDQLRQQQPHVLFSAPFVTRSASRRSPRRSVVADAAFAGRLIEMGSTIRSTTRSPHYQPGNVSNRPDGRHPRQTSNTRTLYSRGGLTRACLGRHRRPDPIPPHSATSRTSPPGPGVMFSPRRQPPGAVELIFLRRGDGCARVGARRLQAAEAASFVPLAGAERRGRRRSASSTTASGSPPLRGSRSRTR